MHIMCCRVNKKELIFCSVMQKVLFWPGYIYWSFQFYKHCMRMRASAKPLFPSLFFCMGRTRALFLLLSQHSEISDKSRVSFTCLCGSCSHRLMFSALCCNCYFPDDDDDEWTHMVLGFRASRLHCPPQSFQPTATRGRDCGSDSAQWCHLWFFAPENWLSGNGCGSLLNRIIYIRTLTSDRTHFGQC